MQRGPGTAESQSQVKRAQIAQVNTQALLTGSRRRRLTDVHKQQADSLLAENLNEAHRFSRVDVERQFTQLGIDLARPFHIAVHREEEPLRLVLTHLPG